LTVDRDELFGMVDRVSMAVGKDFTLPAFTGMRWELADGQLTLVATDRFRLAVGELTIDNPHGAEDDWLIVGESLVKLLKALPSGPLTVGLPPGSDPWITVRAGNITATVREMRRDYSFPANWRGLLPKDASTSVEVDRGKLAKLVAKAEALNGALDRGENLIQFAVDGPGVTVTPKGFQENGQARGTPLLCTVTGGAVTSDFQSKLLLDALGTFTGTHVAIGMAADPNKPILIADTVGELFQDTTSFRHVVMPRRRGAS
jgi:DNA polymerase-3 subunit beta